MTMIAVKMCADSNGDAYLSDIGKRAIRSLDPPAATAILTDWIAELDWERTRLSNDNVRTKREQTVA